MSSRFATTNWSMVLAAGGPDSDLSRRALSALCEAYWHPVYAFVRRQGVEAEEAADLTQGYFVDLLERASLRDLRPSDGRFRSFLFASVKHFLSNQRDRGRALKRGGRQKLLSLDIGNAEGRYQLEPADRLTPEKVFERRWAITVLERTMARLKREFVRSREAQRFERLKGCLTGDEVPAYRDLSEDLGMSEGAVKVAVHRLRKRFGLLLRDEVGQTVSDPRDIDDEIRELLSGLGDE